LVDDIDAFDAWTRHLPLKTFPPALPDEPRFLKFFFETLEHPSRDPFWKDLSIAERHAAVRVPALIVAGWHDVLLGCDLEHFAAMRTSEHEGARASRIVIGPWSHGMFGNVVGDLDFGFRSSGLFMDLREDLTSLHLRWFDRWLKGIRNGVDEEAPVKLFVQGTNRWRDEDAWPLTRAVDAVWYLAPDGTLSLAPPATDADASRYVYDPADPCPTRGGNTLLPRTYPAGPVDQTLLLRRADVLAFTSEPLDRDLEVTGPVRAVLYAATDAPDTDWVVKLCDVHPDGRTFNVCDGILRARFRDSLEAPSLVEPGAVERYEIDLWATSMVFEAGHRLRVLVSSSDFPRYDANPNTGESSYDATRTVGARQTVFHDAQRASHVVLPVVPPS
jgi:hypothetical protein